MNTNIISMLIAIAIVIFTLSIPVTSHFHEKEIINKYPTKAINMMKRDKEFMLDLLKRKGYAGVDQNQSEVLILMVKRIANLGLYIYNDTRLDTDIAKGFLDKALAQNKKLAKIKKCSKMDMVYLTSILDNEDKTIQFLNGYTIRHFRKETKKILSDLNCSNL